MMVTCPTRLAMRGSTSHNGTSIQHYQPHTGTAVLVHVHLSIYSYRCNIHAQQRINTCNSPVSCAEPFLDVHCAESEAFVCGKKAV